MAYIDDLMEQRRDPIGFSLRERKQQVLDQKMIDKTARIDPEALVQSDLMAAYKSSISGSGQSSSLLDFAQSSGYRALGNLGDAGKSISNTMFQTDFDNSAETGWSNQANADTAAGLSADARSQYDQDVQGVYQNIAQGNWWDAAKGSLALGPRVLADSAATIPELLAGTALTATGLGSGAGLALLGNRGRKAYQGIKAIGKGIDEAKKRSKAFELTTKALRSASNTSVMTADMVQQQVNDYKEENNGETPSAQRIAAMIAGNVAANMLEIGVLKNLFLPKLGGKPTLKKFKEEVSNVLEYAEEGTAKSLIKTVAGGIPKVLAAGGGEAAQEYIQSWVEILGVKMKPEEAGGLMASAYKEITSKDNQDQAVLGAMLGFSAGSTAKAALGSPLVAGKAAVDVAKGGTKFAGRVVQDVGSKAAVAALSEKGLQEVKADYDVQKAAVKDAVAALTSKIDFISKADSVSAITGDEELSSAVDKFKKDNNLTDEQLADPKVFKSLKDELIRAHKVDRTKLAVSFKASNLASMAKAAAKINFKRVSNAIELDENPDVVAERNVKAKEDFDTAKARSIASISRSIASLSAATSVDDLKTIPGIADSVSEFRRRPSSDPAEDFSTFRRTTLERLKADKASQMSSEFTPEKRSAAREISEKVQSVIRKSDAETVIGSVRDLSSAAVKTVKEIKSSTALGIIEMSANATAEQSKAIMEAASNLELGDLARTAAVVKEKNPKLAAQLQKQANRMRSAMQRAGQMSDDVLSSENMPDILKAMAKDTKLTKEKASSVLASLYSESKKEFKDAGAVEVLQEALDNYKDSDVAKNSETLKIIEDRLVKARSKLKASGGISGVVKNVKKAISDAADVLIPADPNAKVKPKVTQKEGIEEKVEEVKESDTTESPQITVNEQEKDELANIIQVAKFISEYSKDKDEKGKNAVITKFVSKLHEVMPSTTNSVTEVLERELGKLTETQKDLIRKYYPEKVKDTQSTVITDENFDNIESRELSDQEVLESLAKLHPECKY